MEITHAIRKLLFLEDCVIIPGLGGFVSNYRPAVIDRATGTFIPPTKEIVFNSDLVQNDGTLVNFIAQADAITTEMARRQIDLFVESTREKLSRHAPVFIDGIGQFVQDNNREVRFQADAGTNLFLETFGLASFHMREVLHEGNHAQNRKLLPNRNDSARIVEFAVPVQKKTHNNHNLRRIAIAVPLLIAFSLLPNNTRIGHLNSSSASLIPEPSLFRLNYPEVIQKDTARVIVFPIQEEEVTSETVTSDSVTSDRVASDKVTKKEVTSDRVTSDGVVKSVVGKYPVIAGCFKVKDNAERLLKQLVDKGYPAAITTHRNGFYKVNVQTFASREEAVAGLARLKKAEPGMELWVAL